MSSFSSPVSRKKKSTLTLITFASQPVTRKNWRPNSTVSMMSSENGWKFIVMIPYQKPRRICSDSSRTSPVSSKSITMVRKELSIPLRSCWPIFSPFGVFLKLSSTRSRKLWFLTIDRTLLKFQRWCWLYALLVVLAFTIGPRIFQTV